MKIYMHFGKWKIPFKSNQFFKNCSDDGWSFIDRRLQACLNVTPFYAFILAMPLDVTKCILTLNVSLRFLNQEIK